jgi:hypothetical protein
LIADRIEMTAQSIYFSPQPHYMDAYVVKSGDQLRLISDKYRVPWEFLVRLNRIEPTKIRENQKLKVIKGPFSAVVDLSDYELTIHAHGYYVKKYTVGTGKNNATPLGKFAVLEKVKNPQYTDPNGKVIDADDPANPLGDRWIDHRSGRQLRNSRDHRSRFHRQVGIARMHPHAQPRRRRSLRHAVEGFRSAHSAIASRVCDSVAGPIPARRDAWPRMCAQTGATAKTPWTPPPDRFSECLSIATMAPYSSWDHFQR